MDTDLLTELQFENDLLSKKGYEFQNYVNNLLRYIYGIDFTIPESLKTTYSQDDKGDGGNDGYVRGSGIYFQVYCPQTEYKTESEVYKEAIKKNKKAMGSN